MKISLNLATRPFTDLGPALKRLRIAMIALVTVSALLALGSHLLHDRAEQARAREHALDGQIASIEQRRQSYDALMHRPDNALLLRQTAALNHLFEVKAFSWTLAMENLETVLPAGVQVATLEPVREKDGHISVHLRVVGPRDRAIEFVRNLEHSQRFLMPRIVGENAETANGFNAAQRQEPISASNRFTVDILADYNPPTKGERKPTPVALKHEAGELALTAAPEPVNKPLPMPAQRMIPGTGTAQSQLFNQHRKPHPTSGGKQ
jgi:type IV pilus assembly protein PilN